MPLARDLHPEFGYVGSAPRLLRKLGLVSAFVVFGLVAVVSGVTIFMAGPDPDPTDAMALAAADASTSSPSAAPAEAKAIEGQETLKASATPSSCQDSVSERLGDDCTSARKRSSRPVPAMNERPAVAAVAIGHRHEPAAFPTEPAGAVAAIPETQPDASAVPAGSREVAALAPAGESVAPVAKHSRTSSRHVARREGYSYSGRFGYSRQAYHAGGPGLW